MTSYFREYAIKKLNEAKSTGTTIATVATSTITSNVIRPSNASFNFSSINTPVKPTLSQATTDEKRVSLYQMNEAITKDNASTTLNESLQKIDGINASLDYTILTLQDSAKTISQMNHQLSQLIDKTKDIDIEFTSSQQSFR